MANLYEKLWRDAEERIARGIEENRKSDAGVKLIDSAGRPVRGARLDVEQTSSTFLFGSNAFMLGGYGSTELNQRYEEAFAGLFNSATIPFYWRDLEPVPGELRFEEGSRTIARRPPPDRVVAFARKHGMSMVGHPLVWDFIKWSAPDWLPDDPNVAAGLWEKRVEQIAKRYGGVIPRWDVVNEVLLSPKRVSEGRSRAMVENYHRRAFAWAEKYLPGSAVLMINEVTDFWMHRRQEYIQLIEGLIADGARVKGIGLQFHMFSDAENRRALGGEFLSPVDLLTTLDAMLKFNRPVHISEITMTSLENDAAGQEAQATLTRNYYRLWFSHPAVHAITWWNLPDGGAAPGEDSVASGLISRDLRPKAAYHALHDLVHNQWRTRLTGYTDDNGAFRFRGFHGSYRVDASGKSATFAVTKEGGAVTLTV